MMDVFEAIMTRRSTRKLSTELPDRELIEKVIEAGRVAPRGGNSQTTHFIVITDMDVLDYLSVTVREEFAKMSIEPDMYKSLQNSIVQSKNGDYVFHYGAPILIVTAKNRTV